MLSTEPRESIVCGKKGILRPKTTGTRQEEEEEQLQRLKRLYYTCSNEIIRFSVIISILVK